MPLSPEDNDLLCRVENGAPMGAMIRRHYWIPAIPSSLLEAGGHSGVGDLTADAHRDPSDDCGVHRHIQSHVATMDP